MGGKIAAPGHGRATDHSGSAVRGVPLPLKPHLPHLPASFTLTELIALTDRGASSEPENRRDFYRINFPQEERPRLLLDAPGSVRLVGEVLECSERGLRFRSPMQWLHGTGVQIAGEIIFSRGARARIAGSVIRVTGDEVAIFLGRTPIPLALVMDEQRFLRTRYAAPE